MLVEGGFNVQVQGLAFCEVGLEEGVVDDLKAGLVEISLAEGEVGDVLDEWGVGEGGERGWAPVFYYFDDGILYHWLFYLKDS